MALAKYYTRELLESVPPWLTRVVGEKYLRALGDGIDALVTRTSQAVRHRFPNVVDESALTRIGRERRIRRGPGEDAATYASRLRIWWDMHRIRGGPYALLWNLHWFFLDWVPGRKDVVDHSGKRTWIDAAGAITRDSITWDADGSSEWAQVWVFFYVPELIPVSTDVLVTSDGDTLVTSDGDTLVAVTAISPGALTAADEEIFRCLPREWSAAHIKRTHVVLLYGEACLVGYPPRLVGDPPVTVTPADAPTILVEDN